MNEELDQGYASSSSISRAAYEPKTQFGKKFLLSHFTPFNWEFLNAQTIADQTGTPLAEVEECLAEFVMHGLLVQQPKHMEMGITYTATFVAWTTREVLLRQQGLRHQTLVLQQKYALSDLIIALIKANHIGNDRIQGGFISASTGFKIAHLSLYLTDFHQDDILQTCERLTLERVLVRQPLKQGSSMDAVFDLGVLGHKQYDAEVRARLNIGMRESIIDLILNRTITIFYSWQSEYSPSRNMIERVIEEIIADLSKLNGIVRPLELVTATEAGDGAVRIDQVLLDRIRNAEFFIGDVTPVFAYGRRLRPNDNVLVEVGYALASKPPDQIILVAMKRDDLSGENPRFAFDIEMVRRHEFDSKDRLRKRLRTELEVVLRKRGWLHNS